VTASSTPSTPTPLRVVLVEDSDADAALILLELQRAGYAPTIVQVDQAGPLREALAGAAVDIVIADYNLPSFTGLEALDIHRVLIPDVPFFLVSGTIGEDLAVAAMRAGANDYLLKDNLARLGPAVARELREAELRRERRHDLEKLRESERRFTAIFQNSPVAIVVTTFEEGTILDANPAAIELFGYTRDELIGKTSSAFGAWDNPEDRRAIIGHALAQGRTYSIERNLRRRTGETITVLASFSFMDVGGANRLVVTMQDITARKVAEENLRESEERYRLLVENSSELILEVSLEGIVLYASPNHLQFTGRAPRELVGRSVFQHVHPEDLAQVQARFRDRVASGLFRNQFADGSWHWLESMGRIFQLSSGVQRGVIVSRDVTDRVRAEETRKRLEEQLRQAQKLEALGTLAGGIAHDFNNILTAVMAYTDMAIMEPEAPYIVRQHLTEVRLASDRAKELVRQILTFSRQQKHERKPLDLATVIEEVLKLLRSTLPTTIAIESRLAADVPVTFADPVQIHQVLMNLGTNAAHAMRERSGKLTVRLDTELIDDHHARKLAELRPGRYARLSVSDTGEGMSEETLKRVFEPFFTTKGPGQGTGLGLAVVHGIVRDHDGAIQLESELGRGTTVRIYLPEHTAEAPERAAQRPALPRGKGEHILFIDDEPAIGSVASKLLQRLGYRVSAFEDPVAGLKAFRTAPAAFDLVITDLTMPQLTGIDVARHILETRPRMPILLISGFSATWSTERVRELGILDLIAKPLSMEILASAARHALDHPPPVPKP
jgi:PAS domain S-box-containing protein